MNKKSHPNVSPEEIAKFDAMAKNWWDPEGDMKPLHLLNPLRLQYVKDRATIQNKKILDVGCGGGILSESLAREGGDVTGIDMSEAVIEAAQHHAKTHSIDLHYQCTSIEALATQQPSHFDVITCMELLEHVPDPNSVIAACTALAKPGGWIFFSTLNRNIKSFLSAIVGAEFILNLLPKGTHEYKKFIRPSELSRWASNHHLTMKDLTGVCYHPFSGTFTLSTDVRVNYLMAFQKPGSIDATTAH